MRHILYQVRWFLIPFLIVLAICLIIKLTYTREEIYFYVNALYSPWADNAAPYITNMGSGWTVVVLGLALILYNYRFAFLVSTANIVSALVAQVLKRYFDAPRPQLYFKDQLDRIHFVIGTEQLSLHSFPSGHTVSAFSTAIVITYLCRKKQWGLPLFLLAALVGYSRMYLSQHFFEDVTAGSAIGVMISAIWLYFADNWKFLHSGKWSRGLIKK
ncbi:phosphatase PAP2 family protein [Mucilaginibacter auburnensis]|nr:phosphatase PAP2 family protein [Mucilaginibacter auburnensis]